ncbi:MAG: hypothetical protein J3K34DRAFT_400215 [Monoraphidium minutum]|nr:MAG: hypothetical protein J3K34DRAFT_400215 [Monoraphidium minutum]
MLLQLGAAAIGAGCPPALLQGGAACLRLAQLWPLHSTHAQHARRQHAAAGAGATVGSPLPPWQHAHQQPQQQRAMHTRPDGRAEESPPIVADRGPASATGGRSSETLSAAAVGDPRLRRLIDDVFLLYEARDPDEQRAIIARRYARDAVYQNNIMRVQGADAILRRFSLLPRTTREVRVTYELPVVLGATTTSPGALGDFKPASKADLEVEIKNSQHCEAPRRTPPATRRLRSPGSHGPAEAAHRLPSRPAFNLASAALLLRRRRPSAPAACPYRAPAAP